MVGGTPARSGWWGYLGYPPPPQLGLDDGGTPPHQDLARVPPGMGYPPPPTRQSSIASTCYAAGGMPLAFTQEDFLVCYLFANRVPHFVGY